ncbi:MAG: sugar nucleotidyltransferase [Alphaproteobacteria bacterium]|mgnify:FL=1|jgi:glucose-1-phosphate thymidylyltransferase|tara:strand:- start:9556 stop:10329 length:774 start_codon:yes stop_codon:yes gene_type:complete
MTNVKGIILAGGDGTRLRPMTELFSKQLLPVYNKPMIFYPLSVLIQANIKNILIITKPEEQENFKKIIGTGKNWGVKIEYLVQPKPQGIAQSLIIAKDWLHNSRSLLILGDNLFFGPGLKSLLRKVLRKKNRSTIFAYQVSDPERYGVVSFNKNNKVKSIIEKPKKTLSNWAVTGLYSLDKDAPAIAEKLKPSKRGELEITDLNKVYLKKNKLDVETLGKGFAWLDTGTPDALLEASNFVKILETRQGLLIGDPSVK